MESSRCRPEVRGAEGGVFAPTRGGSACFLALLTVPTSQKLWPGRELRLFTERAQTGFDKKKYDVLNRKILPACTSNDGLLDERYGTFLLIQIINNHLLFVAESAENFTFLQQTKRFLICSLFPPRGEKSSVLAINLFFYSLIYQLCLH